MHSLYLSVYFLACSAVPLITSKWHFSIAFLSDDSVCLFSKHNTPCMCFVPVVGATSSASRRYFVFSFVVVATLIILSMSSFVGLFRVSTQFVALG